ncbi:MAG TPA: outer membrane beta-barrel protein [Flavisolibacter sp.]|nr:outer membrane beta-barrel protein [Flavisolibacter sp.]
MRKICILFALLFVLNYVQAQTTGNQFGIGAELGIGTASGSKLSYGASVKYLHELTSSGHGTISLGILKSSTSEEIGGVKYKTSTSIVPIMAGYRQRFVNFYAEPQLGLAVNTYKVTVDGESDSETKVSLGYAIGGGYITDGGFDLGVRFFNTTQSGAKGIIVFRVGYNFSLGGGSTNN